MNLLSERYRVGDAIYQDAAVTVHAGHDQLLNRPVTIELLKPGLPNEAALAAGLMEKARRLALTELPNVAGLYDQSEQDGRPFLVFEELHGKALRELAPLAPADIVHVVTAAGATLRAAQRAQIEAPPLDGTTVRYGDGRTQIVTWGIRRGVAPQPPEDVRTLAPLLALAATGSPAASGGQPAPAPMMRVVTRALRGEYPNTSVLEDELRFAESSAEDPTMVVPKARPTITLPRAAAGPRQGWGQGRRTAPVQPPQIIPGPAPISRRRWLLPALGGAVLLLGLLAALPYLRSIGSSAAAPAGPTASTTTTTALAAGTAAPAGQPYIVATRDGQRLNVRSGPGQNNPVVGTLANGTVVRVLSPPQASGNFNWVQIEAGNVAGWCVFEALKKQ